MHDDDFLRAIMADLRNGAVRLVYADWLEEQGDPVSLVKAEFLRTTVALSAVKEPTQQSAHQERLQTLAAQLDTDWLCVVSRLPVELCGQKKVWAPYWDPGPLFEFVCDRQWDELEPTDNQTVRFCSTCQQNVYYCDTIVTARNHAWQRQCIAVDLGVIRCEGDLETRGGRMGLASPEVVLAAAQRAGLDPVSEERERRKQAATKHDS